MFSVFYKIFLTLNATSWVAVVFVIKEQYTAFSLSPWLAGIIFMLVPVALTAASERMMSWLSKDDINSFTDVAPANNDFLPTYLGYFFVGLGVDKWQTFLFVYVVIIIFTYLSHAQYFNPIFLLFGYQFYYVTTSKGTKIILISKAPIRNHTEHNLKNLRRINNTTYIAREESK